MAKDCFLSELADSLQRITSYQQSSQKDFFFGPWPIDIREIFYLTDTTLAFVNTSPILDGHVLVCPRRVVQRFTEMTREEIKDLIISVQNVAKLLESMHQTSALTVSMQDGKDAGQTVPHVHFHVIPRRKHDFPKNDQIYEELDQHDSNRNVKPDGNSSDVRKTRSVEEMYQECLDILSFMRGLLEQKTNL